ncbi:DNA-binding transcriptional LysR family regulator [Actinocorallia herbida]|uniref:DNA-binding transcriptional LysR family regulator n=1 Tax=Actinocorallia herbida TaxID=58109 RepID=A0A3N1CVT3_9ACTN|nr:LysR family transcriptional regulator [Actinocorallia herbida]ROO85400.1 DNA-binding transcriptional LysR family regulator [Actinocorallia herbida]
MRIEQLEYLAAVTRLGSLRRAAQELHVSQPALSETIRNLERELSVTLLDRKRSGASISSDGRELLPYITGVLEAVDRLNRAADQQHQSNRMVRLGTVNAATVSLLAPAVQAFRRIHPETRVEVMPAQQADIHRSLLEGGLDLGLVNVLAGDDPPHDLDSTLLLRGRVVACVRADSPLASLDTLTTDDLLTEPLIVMRAGYLMHRYVHRLYDGRVPFSYSTDGAEMGKLMVAEGMGVTLLPDYSVRGDPLERLGAITIRPLSLPQTEVFLLLQGRPSPRLPSAVRDLHHQLVHHARLHPVP